MTLSSPYSSDDFVGRTFHLTRISDLLIHVAGTQRRSLILEGPPKRGKTWLVNQITQQLASYAAPPTDVCLFSGREIPNQEDAARAFLHPMIARIWLSFRHRIPSPLQPFNTIPPAATEQVAVTFLRRYPVSNLIEALRNQLDQITPRSLLLVILDGLDEIATEVLDLVERELIAPLFKNKWVRLLASRRVPSNPPRWQDFQLRKETRELSLEVLAQGEAEAQANHLLSAAGSTLRFNQIVAQLKTAYSWCNPGVNQYFVHRAIWNGGTIGTYCVARCLLLLIQPSRPLVPGMPHWHNREVFTNLDRIINEFPTIHQKTVLRYQLTTALHPMDEVVRDSFLGHLQDRGIGYFVNTGHYVVYPEFVELFSELRARRP